MGNSSSFKEKEFENLSNTLCLSNIPHIILVVIYACLVILDESSLHPCKFKAKRPNTGCPGYVPPTDIIHKEIAHEIWMSMLTNIMTRAYPIICNPNHDQNVYVGTADTDPRFALTTKYLQRNTPEIEMYLAMAKILLSSVGCAGANQQSPTFDKSDITQLTTECELHIENLYRVERIQAKLLKFDQNHSYASQMYTPSFGQKYKTSKTGKARKHLQTAEQRILNLYNQLSHAAVIKGYKGPQTVLNNIIDKNSPLLNIIKSPFSKSNRGAHCKLYKKHSEQGHTLLFLPNGNRVSKLTQVQKRFAKLTEFVQNELPKSRKPKEKHTLTMLTPKWKRAPKLTKVAPKLKFKSPQTTKIGMETAKKQGYDHWTTLFVQVKPAYQHLHEGFFQYLCKYYASKYIIAAQARAKLLNCLTSRDILSTQDQWMARNVDKTVKTEKKKGKKRVKREESANKPSETKLKKRRTK
ncbi:MAG: hypothetical protein GY928_22065 [Colwellia sp.]|nr:hypothetical protein [Colwellia sp.]